jgi:hypothetical protein
MARTAIAVLLLTLFASASPANPIIAEQLSVDFDPPNLVRTVEPEPFTTVEGYLVLDLTTSPMPGATSISFAVDIVPWPSVEPVFETYLPLSVAEGDWRQGVTVDFGECVTDRLITVGRFEFFYEGGAHDILVLEHPEYPYFVYDCEEPPTLWIYCVPEHGAVGKQSTVWGNCGGSPVEELSWGSIKALYE